MIRRLVSLDSIVGLGLALAIAVGTMYLNGRLDASLTTYDTEDFWFEADIGRVYGNMTKRESNHYRTDVHPLFSMLTYPVVHAVARVFGVADLIAVRFWLAAVAFLTAGALFLLLRLLRLSLVGAVVFTLLWAVSAASVFWMSVPESYGMGAISILLVLLCAAWHSYRPLSAGVYVLASAFSLSVTVTNWVAAWVVQFTVFPWRRAVQIGINAFCLTVLLWAGQKLYFTSSTFFLGNRTEVRYAEKPTLERVLTVARVFAVHSFVMPSIMEIDRGRRMVLTVQQSPAGSGSEWGYAAISGLVLLLTLGAYGLVTGVDRKMRMAIGILLLYQFVLHTIYGPETFLYAPHFVPLIVVFASFSALTRLRIVALSIAIGLIALICLNNFVQFGKAADLVSRQVTERFQVKSEMRSRPNDYWPRGIGHVLLAIPGSSEAAKSYHEPGGSFSPTAGSFGVSIWITNGERQVMATSDSLPLSQIKQHLNMSDENRLPGILTETRHYRALWKISSHQEWTLELTRLGALYNGELSVVVRSVGPAGAPLKTMRWSGEKLIVNDRWSVSIDPTPARVEIGSERTQNWTSRSQPAVECHDKQGWCYARLALDRSQRWQLKVFDPLAKSPSEKYPLAAEPIELQLPDDEFVRSVLAQVSHLKMSLVGSEARPGDPMNYPLAWLRDEAYIVTALSRAGEWEMARKMARHLAERDFFGGFGPEADAPGLAIWALIDLAMQANDEELDRWLWPHIRRKAEIISTLLSTREPIYERIDGPIVPKEKHRKELNLVADPPRNGLINGRMDHHRPLLYVNAMSYRGLQDAVWLASRLGHMDDANRWRDLGERVKRAWGKALQPPETANDRTYISALWPSAVGTSNQDILRTLLERRWHERRDAAGSFRRSPLWTYFELAEAHQWLKLGRWDRVWLTLRWFWDNQASPGLFTWWEGSGEENSFRKWEHVRGWVNPPHVTPHYWTAAEMLLLQMAMLAHVEEGSASPTLVIGAGVPEAWLRSPLAVKALRTRVGIVSWSWDGKKLQVHVRGRAIPVKLGNAFPNDTVVEVR